MMTKYLDEITILQHVAFCGTAVCASHVEVPKPTGDDRTPRQTDNVGRRDFETQRPSMFCVVVSFRSDSLMCTHVNLAQETNRFLKH